MLVYGIVNFHRAFPEININYTLSRTAVLNTARDFLIGRHFDISDYQASIIFTYNNRAKLFLEKESGIDRAISLTKDSIDVWYWRVRFYKPLEKQEYSVNVDPKGRVIGFQRTMPEPNAGATLETDVAKVLVNAFVSGPMGEDLNKWELIETGAFDRHKRRDHIFTWEQIGFNEHNAKYRMEVEIQGAKVGSFHRYLDVPQVWQHYFQKMRLQNTLLFALLSVVMFIYFLIHIRDRQIAWKIALIICITLTVSTAISVLNSIPLTTAVYLLFIGMFLFQSENAYFWTSGIIVCAGLAIPALIVSLQYRRRRTFKPDKK